MQCISPLQQRSIMSGYPAYPSGYPTVGSELPAVDSFTNQLLGAAWAQEQAVQPGQPAAVPAWRKGVQGGSPDDLQLRRDIDSGSGAPGQAPSAAAVSQLQTQLQTQLGGSSGPGSETGGSAHNQSVQGESQKPTKRGRGRQRNNTGVETAQQRAHRRFYERKKQRMASLEQEAREKQEQYQELLAINIELKRKHEALERAVAGREEHIVLIQALGSLSLAARGAGARQPPHPAPLHPGQLPTLPEQQQPEAQQPGQHQEPAAALVQPQPRSKSSLMQQQQPGSWANLQDSLTARADSAPAAADPQQQQQQPPQDLMPQVEEAGPFGMIQLPQYGSLDDEALPLVLPRSSNAAAAAAATPQHNAAAAAAAVGDGQQGPTGELMSWTDQLEPLAPEKQQQQLQQQRQQQQQQGGATDATDAPVGAGGCVGGFLDLLGSMGGMGMSLTRSLSLPARTAGFDAEPGSLLNPLLQPPQGLGAVGGQGSGLAPKPSRSFNALAMSQATAWNSKAGLLERASGGVSAAAAAAAAAAAGEWDLDSAFAAASARGGEFGGFLAAADEQQQQPLLLPLGSSRHHSWSGGVAGAVSGGGLLPVASLSFRLASEVNPAAALNPSALNPSTLKPEGLNNPQQGGNSSSRAACIKLEQQQQQGGQRKPLGWANTTITTTGPMVSPSTTQGQQLQPLQQLTPPLLLQQRPCQPSFPGFAPVHPQQQQQQGLSQGLQQQGQQGLLQQQGQGLLQQQQQQGLMPRRSATEQPEPQQVVQQLQQMGHMAFSADLTVQLATADMPEDIFLFDADMMDMLLERMSQQQSVEMLSPLPSVPSALLTGDTLRLQQQQALAAAAATADPAAAGAGGDTASAAGNTAPPAAAGGAGQPSRLQHATGGLQEQQQQQQQQQQQEASLATQLQQYLPQQQQHLLGVPGHHLQATAAVSPAAATAAAAGGGGAGGVLPPGPPSAPLTLLEASRQLQARHIASGFFPSRVRNEMFYVHEIVDWYREKLLQLQELLPYVDRANPDVPCSLSLVQAMEEVIDGVRKFGTRNRIGMWELKLINLETGAFEEAPPSHWAMVADRIQLPPQMRDSAIACYTLYLEYVEKVKADRVAVLQDFSLLEQQLLLAAAAAAGSGNGGGSNGGGCGSSGGSSAPGSLQFRWDGYEEYQQLLERLQLSLKREHMVANMLSYSLSQITSHVQMAKGMLACWPYWPDGPSVLAFWLAEEQAGGNRGLGVGSRGAVVGNVPR